MKRCTYCGKEYSDEVTVCPLDQNPVTVGGKPVAMKKVREVKARTKLEIQAHLATRPMTVKIGIGFLAFSTLVDFVWEIVVNCLHPSRDPWFYFLFVWTFSFTALVLYFAFRGKNWARWLIVFAIILGTIDVFRPNHRLSEIFNFYALMEFIGVIALFLRASNEWYRGTKKVSPPVPV